MTSIKIKKTYLTHVCLRFTQVIYSIPNHFIIRLRWGYVGKVSLLMQLISSLPLTLLFFVALVCELSSVLCKGHFCYKFHETFIDIGMLAVLLP